MVSGIVQPGDSCALITVELLGGARKSFPAGPPDIGCGPIPLDEALRRICEAVPDGAPRLDLPNSLVALNGADSSALRGAAVSGGDTITIIPIVHGGQAAGARGVLVARVGRAASPGEGLVDSLRAEFPRLAIQVVRRRMVLGESHARRVAQVSLAASRRGALLTRRPEADMLLRFAGTPQISQAIRRAGARPTEDAVIVAAGAGRALEALRARAGAMPRGSARYGSEASLRREFGITAAHLRAVGSARALEDILVERAAVLL